MSHQCIQLICDPNSTLPPMQVCFSCWDEGTRMPTLDAVRCLACSLYGVAVWQRASRVGDERAGMQVGINAVMQLCMENKALALVDMGTVLLLQATGCAFSVLLQCMHL